MVKRVCKRWADFVLFGEEENWPIYRSGLFSSCQHVWLTDWSCTVWRFDNIMYPFQYNSTNRPLALNFFPRSQVMGSHEGCLLLNNKRTIHTITMTLVTAWCFQLSVPSKMNYWHGRCDGISSRHCFPQRSMKSALFYLQHVQVYNLRLNHQYTSLPGQKKSYINGSWCRRCVR